MTLRGIFTLIFESFLLIMALGTEIKQFLIVAVCIGGLWCYSLISVLLSVLSLKFSVFVENPRHFREEKALLNINLKGIAFLPVICKLVICPADKGDIAHSTPLLHTFILGGFRYRRNYKFALTSAHTGFWRLGVERLRVSDVFGMFSFPLLRTRRKKQTVTLTVLPKSHTLPEFEELMPVYKGYTGDSLDNAESGELLSDSRLYRHGDTLKRINWKQSARTGKLFTRQYEKPGEPKTVIIVDNLCLEDSGDLGDICRETALFLGQHYALRGSAVTFMTPNERDDSQHFEGRFTSTKTEEMEDFLTEIPFVKSLSALEIYSLETASFSDADEIFIITSNPSAVLFSAVLNARSRGVDTTCIVPVCSSTPKSTEKTAMEILGEAPITLSSPEEISRKVGELL